MHITSLFSYTQQLKELLNLVFLLILCSQTYPNLAKASTHQYTYTLYRFPAPFYECLITVVTALLRTTTTPPKNSVLPLRHLYPYPYQGLTYFLIILVVFSVNQLFFVFSFPITLFFLLLPFVLFLFNLLYFCYSSSFEASISTFFFLLILHLFSLSTFFFGKDPMILLSCFFLLSFLVSSTLLFFFSVLPIYLVSILSLFLFSVSSPLFYILLMFPFTLSLVLLFVFFLFPVILYFTFLSLYLCQLI